MLADARFWRFIVSTLLEILPVNTAVPDTCRTMRKVSTLLEILR